MNYYKPASLTKSEYFNYETGHSSDKNLYDLLNTEFINKYGTCLKYYITTYDLNYDKIFGEDNNRSYVRCFDFMSYYSMPEENKMFTYLGIDYTDDISMKVSKSHFNVASSVGNFDPHIPQIGDIIQALYGNLLYEVTEVAEGVQEFLQSRQYIWELVVKPYRKNNISVTPAISGSDVYRLNKNETDLFDIRGVIETQNEQVKYKQKNTEQSVRNPYAG